MKDSLNYEGLKFEKGSVTKVTDPLAVEQALQIDINGKAFTVVMQTPGAEKELVYGLLYGEDVLKKNSVFTIEYFKNESDIIEKINLITDPKLSGKGYLSSRSLLSVSSCGICGKQELEQIKSTDKIITENSITVTSAYLLKVQQKLFKNQKLFELTGGCHGVAAFDENENLLSLHEDIGRHNALDKVIGELLFKKELDKAKCIAFSGRVSYEIVSKSFRAKIPIIIAVSSPSSLAVDFAKEFGITLIGFARNDKMTCYSNPDRIIE